MIDQVISAVDILRDDVVNLLPFVLLEIRNYTNQYFLTTKNSNVVKIEDDKIYLEDTSDFKHNDIIEILNSESNTMLYTVNGVETDYITVDQVVSDEVLTHVKVIKLSFRGVNVMTVVNMLNYTNTMGDEFGVASKSMGQFSVSYAQSKVGLTYPDYMYGSLKSLRKINDDKLEYRRKGYVITE